MPIVSYDPRAVMISGRIRKSPVLIGLKYNLHKEKNANSFFGIFFPREHLKIVHIVFKGKGKTS